MPQAEILRILQAVQAVIRQNNVSDEEAQALFIAAAKSSRPKRKRKVSQ